MRKRVAGIGLITIVLVAVLVLQSDVSVSSDQCVLCTAENRPNLCLIDLNTGEIGELMIYDVGLLSADGTYYVRTEFSKEQTFGTFSFVNCVGVKGYRTTGTYNKCSLTMPDETKRIQKVHYCKECYELLASVSPKGHLILDLYEPENTQVYSIKDGDRHSIRCFEVSVFWDEENDEMNVDVSGTLEIEDGEHGTGMIVNYP